MPPGLLDTSFEVAPETLVEAGHTPVVGKAHAGATVAEHEPPHDGQTAVSEPAKDLGESLPPLGPSHSPVRLPRIRAKVAAVLQPRQVHADEELRIRIHHARIAQAKPLLACFQRSTSAVRGSRAEPARPRARRRTAPAGRGRAMSAASSASPGPRPRAGAGPCR